LHDGKKGNEFSVRIIDSCVTVSVADILTARLHEPPTVLGEEKNALLSSTKNARTPAICCLDCTHDERVGEVAARARLVYLFTNFIQKYSKPQFIIFE
jgi:hypothetical protein